jgi:nucleoside 2-deoxyribosyltransferase
VRKQKKGPEGGQVREGKYKIYMAGLINPNSPETYEWRENLIYIFTGNELVELINPIKTSPSESKDSDGMLADSINSRAIVMKDFASVMRANAFVTDLNSYGSKRPHTGTLYELAWAWEHHIPVNAVLQEDNEYLLRHPFVTESVTQWFRGEHAHYEAVENLLNYYA